MIEQMLSTGIPPESIVLAVRAIELRAAKNAHTAEKRRAWDRDRKRKAKEVIPPEFHRKISTGIPPEACGSPLLPSLITTFSQKERSEIGALEREFATFWQQCPNRVGKRAAHKAFATARQRASMPEIMDGLARYAAKTDDRPWCNPATWLNQDRWTDQPGPSQERKPRPGSKEHRQEENWNVMEALRSYRDDPSSADDQGGSDGPDSPIFGPLSIIKSA